MTSAGLFGVRPRTALGLITLTALVIRILHVASYEPAPSMDGAIYVSLADEGFRIEKLLGPQGLFWYAPGYPLFLMPFLRALGFDLGLRAAAFAQAALGAWTCVLVYALARRIHSRRAGLAASLLACFYPHFLFYSSVFMSESLFIPLYLASLLAFLRAARRPGRWRLYRAGLLAAAATLVRPAGATLFPAALLAAWRFAPAATSRSEAWWARGRALLLLAAGGLTLMGPWALRNRVVYGYMVVTSPYGAFNLATGNLPEPMVWHHPAPTAPGGLSEQEAQFRAMVWDFVSSDPWGALFIVMRLKWLRLFWASNPPWPLYSSNPSLFAGEIFFPFVSWRIALLLGAAGLGALLLRRRPLWWTGPACIAAYVAFYLVYIGECRYRLPVEAFFLAWAGAAVVHCVGLVPRLGRSRAPTWGAAVCLVLAAVLAQAGASAARTRAFLQSPDSLVASAGPLDVQAAGPVIHVFGEAPVSLDRGRGRYLKMSFSTLRRGPKKEWFTNGRIAIVFLDRDGCTLGWADTTVFVLEALLRDRWVDVAFKTQIPPGATACSVRLTPDRRSPDTVRIDRAFLRYSRGNDLALEFLYPYLRFDE